MAEEGRLHNPTLRAVGGAVHGGVAKLVGGVAGLFGIFIAGYTGGLLSVTNRPIWADSPWLGALFLASGGSAGAAALIPLAAPRGAAGQALAPLSACATQARGGGPGADLGNHDRVAALHAGAKMYYRTPCRTVKVKCSGPMPAFGARGT